LWRSEQTPSLLATGMRVALLPPPCPTSSSSIPPQP
jgi:hypothetical protein